MFKHLEVADGLSSNTVYSIYQDRDGFMWFGTRNGLNRYDGYTFRVFRHLNNDPYSLPDNVVANICESPEGMFWVKTERGYALFEKDKGVFVNDLSGFMKQLGSNAKNPMSVYVDKKGYTWLYAAGEGCYRYKQGEKPKVFVLRENGLPVSGITAVGECRDGILLLYDTGLLVCIGRDELDLKWKRDNFRRGNTFSFRFLRMLMTVCGYTACWGCGYMMCQPDAGVMIWPLPGNIRQTLYMRWRRIRPDAFGWQRNIKALTCSTKRQVRS